MASTIEREPGLDWALAIFGCVFLWNFVGIFVPRLRWKWSMAEDNGTRLGLLSTAGVTLAFGSASLLIYAIGRDELIVGIAPLFILLGMIVMAAGKPRGG